jgi:hypothetical protein
VEKKKLIKNHQIVEDNLNNDKIYLKAEIFRKDINISQLKEDLYVRRKSSRSFELETSVKSNPIKNSNNIIDIGQISKCNKLYYKNNQFHVYSVGCIDRTSGQALQQYRDVKFTNKRISLSEVILKRDHKLLYEYYLQNYDFSLKNFPKFPELEVKDLFGSEKYIIYEKCYKKIEKIFN